MSAGAPPATGDRRWLLLATVLVGTFVGTINNSVANIAVLDVLHEFQLGLGAAVWFVTGYVLAFAVLMPAAGRLADAYGVRRVYRIGLVGFLLASVAVAVAPTYPLAAAARVAQGVCNAPVLPTVMVTVATAFPPHQRGRAMGLWAAANGTAIALGPPLGGLVTDAFGWRAVFWANVPLVALGLLLATRFLPETPTHRPEALDLGGGALLTGGLTAVMVALSQGPTWGWSDPATAAPLAGGLVLLVWFWRRSHRVPSPFLEVDVLRNHRYALLASVAGLQMVILFAVLFTVPLLLVFLFGRGVGAAGGLVFALPLTMVVAGPPIGALTDRLGVRRLAGGGAALLLGAAGLLAAGVAWRHQLVVLAGIVVVGAGVSAIQAPTAVGVAEEVSDQGRGAAMGLFHTIRFLAGVLGTAGAAALFTAASGGGDLAALPDARLGDGFVAAFAGVAAVALLTLALTRLVARPVPAAAGGLGRA